MKLKHTNYLNIVTIYDKNTIAGRHKKKMIDNGVSGFNSATKKDEVKDA